VLGLLYSHNMTEWSFLYVSIALTTFVVLRHRTNIYRLIHGTEQRFRKSGH
jgi:glycerol-3-phosphate acyltransferase PlsY